MLIGGAILGALNTAVGVLTSTNGVVTVKYHFGEKVVEAEVPTQQ